MFKTLNDMAKYLRTLQTEEAFEIESVIVDFASKGLEPDMGIVMTVDREEVEEMLASYANTDEEWDRLKAMVTSEVIQDVADERYRNIRKADVNYYNVNRIFLKHGIILEEEDYDDSD